MGVVTVHALQRRSLTEAQRTRSEEGNGRNGRGRFRHHGWKELPNPKHGNRNKRQTRNPSDGKQIGPIISTFRATQTIPVFSAPPCLCERCFPQLVNAYPRRAASRPSTS